MDMDAVFADWMCITTHKFFIVPSVGGATRFANFQQKFSKMQKKSAAELCQIVHMVTIEIVISSTLVMGIRVTISCRSCISLKVLLLFRVNFLNFVFYLVSSINIF